MTSYWMGQSVILREGRRGKVYGGVHLTDKGGKYHHGVELDSGGWEWVEPHMMRPAAGYAVGDWVETENGIPATVLEVVRPKKSGKRRYRVQLGSEIGEIRVCDEDYLKSPSLPSAQIPGPTASDPVQSPSHYDLPGGIQVIDLIRGESFLRGNALKYIFRAPHKGSELEDMKKSREYINWEIERLENEQSE